MYKLITNLINVYYLVVCVCFIAGLLKVKKNKPDFLMVVWSATAILSEAMIDFGVNQKIMTKPESYLNFHIFGPINMFLVCLYYNYAVPLLKQKHIGWWVGVSVILFSIISGVFIEPVFHFPSALFLYGSFCISCLSLLAYYTLFREHEFPITMYVLFWLTSLILAYYASSYMLWGMIHFFFVNETPYKEYIGYIPVILYSLGIMLYAGLSVVFLNYRKLIPSGE